MKPMKTDIADLDRATNRAKQLISAAIVVLGILAALALGGCCDDEKRRPATPEEEPHAQWFQG